MLINICVKFGVDTGAGVADDDDALLGGCIKGGRNDESWEDLRV